LIFFLAQVVYSQNRIAFTDFTVHSTNKKYEFLGKGISEMVAVELSGSSGISLVEREERVALLDELEFTLSDIAENSEQQVRVGKMLSADYLVFGEIIDMDDLLLISIRVTEVESGEIIWRDKLSASLRVSPPTIRMIGKKLKKSCNSQSN
jgi:TolB-like protein